MMVIHTELEREESFLAPNYESGDDDADASMEEFEVPTITIAWLEERIAELEEVNNAICSARAVEEEHSQAG